MNRDKKINREIQSFIETENSFRLLADKWHKLVVEVKYARKI
jgi:hypothetical protein